MGPQVFDWFVRITPGVERKAFVLCEPGYPNLIACITEGTDSKGERILTVSGPAIKETTVDLPWVDLTDEAQQCYFEWVHLEGMFYTGEDDIVLSKVFPLQHYCEKSLLDLKCKRFESVICYDC